MVVLAIKLFLSLILHKASLCLREVGERNIIKFAGDLPIVNHAFLNGMQWSLCRGERSYATRSFRDSLVSTDNPAW